MIPGAWICRACWKSNRPEDERCYRCKTPREDQLAVEAGSSKEQTTPGTKLRGRMDAQFGLLAILVGLPMWLSAWTLIAGSVLLLIYGVLELLSGDVASALAAVVIAAVIVLVAMLWRFVSRSVRRHARWAYAVAAILYLLPSAPLLLGLVELPREAAALPDWYFTVQTAITIVYLLLGVCAVFLLITSFIRDHGGGEATGSTEAAGSTGR